MDMRMRGSFCGLIAMGVVMGTVAVAAVGQGTSPDTSKAVEIKVDLAKKVGRYEPIYRAFGADEANYMTAPNGRKLLRELHDMSPVPVFIRVHHLLTSGDGTPELKWSSTGVYSEDAQGRPVYQWKVLDGIFDAYKAAGVKPMVELGFMPKDLAAKLPNKPDQAYQMHFPGDVLGGASNNPPKDYAKWQGLSQAVVAHLVQRYGKDEVLTWYFEVWNEPDISYWHGTPEEYYKLYDAAAAGVKAALPGARVGGPATTGPSGKARDGGPDGGYKLLKGFLEHVRDTKQPLDFISFHAKGSPKIVNGEVTMGINHELRDIDAGFKLIASFPEFRHLPVIMSEADPEGCAACSAKMNPANAYRNGTLYPAYTAAAYARIFQLADEHDINLIAMLSWAFEFEGRDTFEGFRSLATNGIDKPVLNFFRMAAKMGGERVAVESTGAVPLDGILDKGVRGAPDVDGLATVNGRKAMVMVWNYQDTIAQDPATAASVVVDGLPAGVKQVKVREWRIDGTHSNAYTVWQQMGSPAQLTVEGAVKLEAAGQLQEVGSARTVAAANGGVRLEETLQGESVSLYEVSW
jgi:xylan 1,4-beta-xylosidase